MLRVGGLSCSAGSAASACPALQAAGAGPARPENGPARSVIMFNLLGAQPDGHVRHETGRTPKCVASSLHQQFAAGPQICEHLPRTAKIMHRASLVRTITHKYNSHNPLAMMTGYADGKTQALSTSRSDPPESEPSASTWAWGPAIFPERSACRVTPDGVRRACTPASGDPAPTAVSWARSTTRCSVSASHLPQETGPPLLRPGLALRRTDDARPGPPGRNEPRPTR
ncbi:MAG: hypothetical protein Ct9H300mP1_03330 [Planctomycetaceae bacterium]|nr:MAG: hypothetical protein Ct9H300mP1_03330 [Planctomycetaceae bacterium]